MDMHQMLLIQDILHCKVMSKMKDVDQNFDALYWHILAYTASIFNFIIL